LFTKYRQKQLLKAILNQDVVTAQKSLSALKSGEFVYTHKDFRAPTPFAPLNDFIIKDGPKSVREHITHTPLSVAVVTQQPQMVQLLLEAGCNPNQWVMGDVRPIACFEELPSSCLYLCIAGKQTEQSHEIYQLLRDHGADIRANSPKLPDFGLINTPDISMAVNSKNMRHGLHSVWEEYETHYSNALQKQAMLNAIAPLALSEAPLVPRRKL